MPDARPSGRWRGWRRLIFLFGLMAASGIGAYLGRLTGAEFVALWKVLGAAYLGSDVGEKATSAWASRPPAVIDARHRSEPEP